MIASAIRVSCEEHHKHLASELLAACKAMVAYQESTDLDDEPEDGEYGDGKLALIAARAAIAKAEPPAQEATANVEG